MTLGFPALIAPASLKPVEQDGEHSGERRFPALIAPASLKPVESGVSAVRHDRVFRR